MITNRQFEIKKIKKEIEMYNLTLPTDFEFEIAELVLSYIKNFQSSISFFPQSYYSQEIKKTLKELNRHFADNSTKHNNSNKNFILTNEISQKAFKILNEIIISEASFENYQCIFEIQNKKVSIHSLNISCELDTLSYVYLGHEIIHLLKETNLKEYKNHLQYSEVLPMLYEFIQMKYKKSSIKRNIVSRRILFLSEMNQDIIKAKNLIENKFDFEIYKLLDYTYFISFYYTILLYELYSKYPQTILKEFKNVLLHKKTTQELLEYFDIYNKYKTTEFDKGYKRILNS